MLNSNQRRALEVTLRIVEEELRRLEWILDRPGENLLFSRFTEDLLPGEKDFIRGKIQGLLEEMASLKSLLDLHAGTREWVMSSIVRAVVLYLLVELEDSDSKRMKKCGPISPNLKDSLDVRLDRMKSLLQEMNPPLRTPRKEKVSP